MYVGRSAHPDRAQARAWHDDADWRPPISRCRRVARSADSDIVYSFRRSTMTMVAAAGRAVAHRRRGAVCAADRAAQSVRSRDARACSTLTIRRSGSRAAIGASCSAPTTRAATCSRRSSTARGSRSPSASCRSFSLALGVTLGLVAGYAGGSVDSADHARRRRAADLPGDPDRAADRRHGARAVRAAATRRTRSQILGAGARDRPHLLGAIRAHRARLDLGRTQQGLRPRRAPDRRPARPHHVRAYPAQRDRPGAGDRARSISALAIIPRRRCRSSASGCRRRSPRSAP